MTDFTTSQGETFLKYWLYQNAGVNVNLAGYKALMHLRRKHTDPSPAAILSTENNNFVLGDSDYNIKLTIPASTAANLVGSYVYDLKVYNGTTIQNGFTKEIDRGTITFLPWRTK